MTDTDVFEAWNRDSQPYRRYTATARSLLDCGDEELRHAQSAWADFFVESHGDVFAQMDIADPRECIFVDTLYYDFVVDRLLAVAEETFGFEVANPEPHHDTDTLRVDFGELHETIVEAASLSDPLAADLTRETFLDADGDALRDLYESIVSRDVRLALGEYYTPRGVAELAVEALDVTNTAETFLDPGCGSGVFLAVCIDHNRDAFSEDRPPDEIVDIVTNTVYGIDLNPVAVKSAKLNYVLSLLPELGAGEVDKTEIPVYLADSLGLTRDEELSIDESPDGSTVDHLVGNPPWITWDTLSEPLKAAWRDTYIESLGLFPHGGAAARLGHANDDVSIPFAWACIHRYLRAGGDASFVLKRDLMKGPAGKLLRTQRVGSRSVAVRSVHDFTDLRPFGEEVGAAAAIYTLSADDDPEFPIPVVSWTRGSGLPDFSSAAAIRKSLAREETGFVPVGDDPSSAWVRQDAERRALGECDHEIRHGLKDDATAVFTVDRPQLADLDSELVYPYLRSKHVVKYGLFGHDLHLVPMEQTGEDNEAELQNQYPRSYDYLQSHREQLETRESSWLEEGPFYNVFGLGEYTWADYKVVWCRLGFKPHFAVVSTVEDPDLGEKLVVPGDHCMFVPTDDEREAHFVTALLNSATYQKCLRDLASQGKASLSKTVLSKLALPEYGETTEHQRLAELSMQAHEIVPRYTDTSKREYNQRTIEELEVVQSEIDGIVAELLASESTRSESDDQPQ